MQQSSSTAELIWQMFRQESHHASAVEPTEKHRRRRPAWRREVHPEAVLDARRLVRRSSWAPGELSGGRLGRQEARPEAVWAVLAARSPSGGRLDRQQARPEAVWAARRPECRLFLQLCCKMQVWRRLHAGRRPELGSETSPRRQVAKAPSR